MKNGLVIIALVVSALAATGCAMKAAQTPTEPVVAPAATAAETTQEEIAAAPLSTPRTIEEEVVADRPATSALSGGAVSPPAATGAAPLTAATDAAGSQELRTVYFEYNQHLLAGEAPEILAGNAAVLKAKPGLRLVLQGHCDERGSEQYNIALGERRAEAVKEYLVSLGVAEERLETVSFGEERPADPGQSEEAWARNRRVEFAAAP